MFQKTSSELTRRGSIDEVETVVGPSVVVEGDFSSEGNILVKGTVSGNVKTGQLLTVEIGAKILAHVKAKNAVVSGEIKGNVRVLERLELFESSKVFGDITCKILAVAPGALIQGKVSMKDTESVSEEESKIDKKKIVGKIKSRGVFEETSEAPQTPMA